jgi:hypothetical protein
MEHKVIVMISAPTAQNAQDIVEDAMGDLMEQQDIDELYDFDWDLEFIATSECTPREVVRKG